MYGIFVAVSMAVLISAAISDVRTREASDLHWHVLFAAGAFRFALESDLISVLGIVMLAIHVFTDRIQMPSLVGSAICFAVSKEYSVLIMSAAMIAAYHIGLIKGGADAKAMIAISVAFPTGAGILPPAFSVMMLALVLSLSVAFYNLYKSHRRSISGYYMDEGDADASFVWIVEKKEDGTVYVTPMIPFLFPIAISFFVVMVLGVEPLSFLL